MADIQPLAPPQPDAAPAKTYPVELELPCGTCVHASVCRIRPTLFRLERVPVPIPATDRAIGIELRAAVTCEFFLSLEPKRRGRPAGRKLNLTDEERQRRGDRLRNFNQARAGEAEPA